MKHIMRTHFDIFFIFADCGLCFGAFSLSKGGLSHVALVRDQSVREKPEGKVRKSIYRSLFIML